MTSEMDELYRKAAENYPLDTGKPAWEALLKKMETNELQNNKINNKKNGLISLLMLLLFLPLAISDIQFSKPRFLTSEKRINSGNETGQQNSIIQIINDDDKGISNDKIVQPVNSKAFLSNFHQPRPSSLIPKEDMAYKNSNVAEKAIPALPAATEIEMQDNKITTVINNDNFKTQLPKKVEAVDTLPKVSVATKQKEDQPYKSKKFYAGIIAGPEVSAVKMQNVDKVGLNAGVVAGVQLNKKIQVETGLLFDRKYYKSKGDYFKTNKITLPAGASIIEVSGHCDMIEIPVNFNYLLKQKPGHNIYATAGLSSFIMKKEVYSFEVNRNGYNYPRAVNYDNPGTYAFAVINLGAGYNKQMGKNGNLRIAPSIKLPIRKMGTGSLPIQSATVYLGYTRKLF
ncbi:MAG: hypothetical protein ABIW38_00135 [Ferruginibacter sp.]